MPQITFEMTDAEAMVLEHIALDPLDYIDNLATWRAQLAMEELSSIEIERMLADPNTATIPSTKDEIVLNANVQTAAERAAQGQE
jgi:hypothetical protein